MQPAALVALLGLLLGLGLGLDGSRVQTTVARVADVFRRAGEPVGPHATAGHAFLASVSTELCNVDWAREDDVLFFSALPLALPLAVWHNTHCSGGDVADAGKHVSGETSESGAAVAALDADHVLLAWAGRGNRLVNWLVVVAGRPVVASKGHLDDAHESVDAPALTAGQTCPDARCTVVLAWRTPDDAVELVRGSVDVGAAGPRVSWGPVAVLDSVRTPSAPGLAVFHGSLWLAVRGADDDRIVVNRLSIPPDAQPVLELQWAPDALTGTAGAGPALARFRGRLYMAFRTADDAVHIAWSADGLAWTPSETSVDEAETPSAPALVPLHDRLLLAWHGKDSLLRWSTTHGENEWDDVDWSPAYHSHEQTWRSPAGAMHEGTSGALVWIGTNGQVNLRAIRDPSARLGFVLARVGTELASRLHSFIHKAF